MVDDEPDLRALLADYLGMQGYAVGTAEDAVELDARLAEGPADVIVLDINMPGENGLAALARLRAAGMPGGGDPADRGRHAERPAGRPDRRGGRLRGQALRAARAPRRIRAVLRRLEARGRRRGPAPARPALRMGRCTFDTEARCLRDPDGGEIALTAMEFDLLEVFSRHPRQTLSRSRLAELAHGRPLRPATARSTSASPACAPRSARTPAPRGRSGRCMARATSSTRTRDTNRRSQEQLSWAFLVSVNTGRSARINLNPGARRS